MKPIFFVLSLAIFTIAACNEPKQSSGTSQNADEQAIRENKIMIPASSCYAYNTVSDTILLKVEIFPNVVTGKILYKFKEKDSNTGEFDGKVYGDTLLANYRFMSEGVLSSRQVIFLIREGVAIEGYGNLEEKDGKMVLKNVKDVIFRNGVVLRKVACGEY